MAEKTTEKTTATRSKAKASETFSDAEKAAMKERAAELKAEGKGGSRKTKKGEADVLAKIAEMPEADRVMAERIHEIVKANAPDLTPKTWYGMPAYANSANKVVCFFQAADRWKARYATLGFDEAANLDQGSMWPTSFALKKLTKKDEATIATLVKQAVS